MNFKNVVCIFCNFTTYNPEKLSEHFLQAHKDQTFGSAKKNENPL